MLSTANCVSFRSTLEGLLPWASLRTTNSQTGAGDKNRARKKSKDIFSVMVTPDRIPKFFIPPLDVHAQAEQPPEAEEGCQSPALLLQSRGEGSRRARSPAGSNAGRDRVLMRGSLRQRSPESCGDGALLYGELERAADHSDPATRAALSLPHLQKITTPYGFPALGEIPHIRRKESLFFERDVAEILLKSSARSRALGRSRSSPLTDPKLQESPGTSAVSRANRSASWETITTPSLPSYPPQAPRSLTTLVKDKSKFQILIKKHLASIKRMRSNSSSARLADRMMSSFST
ncbi:C2 calcium-dependent domain-containing protein 4C-like [Pristis pectinata]|uniref:C2 calcium-dependent domain-containing protein 4C-like n=1 Tax=Pristis pectinata TaxID=685728 RepID=UPI00223CECB4|nr:C2 calcium-dependent domain-containing protein 4C-like [Pristis pectinata]